MKRRLADLKERWFPKGFRRSATRYVNRIARRVARDGLAACFADLHIEPGAVICIHSALSQLGYMQGGPESVILALQDAVPECTIMMPTFPFGGPAVAYVSSNPVYDPASTRSKMGLLSETLRQMPDARRSLHPTHPCAALGPEADALIDGSELSVTPFGDSSTHGRFSAHADAIVLLLHTNNTSLVHRFQEMVDMPNLFMPEPYQVRGCDRDGETRAYSVKVHAPDLPMYVAISRNESGGTEYLWLPDYVVQFPQMHGQHISARVKSMQARRFLSDRQQHFFDAGTFRKAQLGTAEILAIRLNPWQERICQDLRESLAAFSECYTLGALQAAQRTGLLVH